MPCWAGLGRPGSGGSGGIFLCESFFSWSGEFDEEVNSAVLWSVGFWGLFFFVCVFPLVEYFVAVVAVVVVVVVVVMPASRDDGPGVMQDVMQCRQLNPFTAAKVN